MKYFMTMKNKVVLVVRDHKLIILEIVFCEMISSIVNQNLDGSLGLDLDLILKPLWKESIDSLVTPLGLMSFLTSKLRHSFWPI